MKEDMATPPPNHKSNPQSPTLSEGQAVNLNDITLSLPSEAGSVNILRGVSLQVQSGQSIGIVGPSGSGKSTLMAVMTGLDQVTGGDVVVARQRLNDLSEDALALFRRNHTGIVLQAFRLIPTMTALENVAVPLELAGRKDAFDVAQEELKAVGLGHRLTHYPAQLSGGEQQRVALARAIAPNPPLLFADEPTGNLDSKTGAQVVDIMFKLHRERAMTLILITHDLSLADRCERVIEMRDGLLVAPDTQPDAIAAQ